MHSKACLRKKKEERKKREEAAAKANGTAPVNAEKDAPGEADDQQPEGSRAGTAAPDAEGVTAPATEGAAAKKKDTKKASENKKKRKAGDLDDTASIASSTGAAKPPTKKQKKKEAAANTPTEKKTGGHKPKGPVDVEKQCGVLLPNGSMCARSLTCKSHSMGAKRNVPGRSLPYDMLLQNYQKKNQARQQKERMAAHGAAAEEMGDATGGVVDSDEERERVMSAIARSRPRPLTADLDAPSNAAHANNGPLGNVFGAPAGSLNGFGSAQYVSGSVAKRFRYVRLKEMLGNALGGSRGSGLFSTAQTARDRNVGDADGAPLSAGVPPMSAGLNGPSSSGVGSQSRRQSSVGGESMKRAGQSMGDVAMAT